MGATAPGASHRRPCASREDRAAAMDFLERSCNLLPRSGLLANAGASRGGGRQRKGMDMFRLNLPTAERLIRIALGLGLAAYAWAAGPNLIFVATGLCVALTGLVGFCPVCAVAGRRLKPKP